jgi:hypothetical protein
MPEHGNFPSPLCEKSALLFENNSYFGQIMREFIQGYIFIKNNKVIFSPTGKFI